MFHTSWPEVLTNVKCIKLRKKKHICITEGNQGDTSAMCDLESFMFFSAYLYLYRGYIFMAAKII